MHRLRDQIEQAVDVAMNMGVGHGQEQVTVDQYGNARDRATDRILALIAEAMLSETAVETAAKAIHSTEHLLVGEWGPLTEREELDKRVIDKEAKDGYRYAARLSNKAALQAAGITDAEQEGGEGE